MSAAVEKTAVLKSCTVHYRQAGSGAPLVLLHPSSGVRVTAAVQSFADRFTVFQPTCPGFDGTPLPAGELGVAGLAQWLAEFIGTVVGGPATLVGHSFGGWVASWLAVQRPDLVTSLVLQCPLGFGPLAVPAPGATPAQVLARTYSHPERRVAETRSDEMMAHNRALAGRYGHGMTEDAALMAQMRLLETPVLVLCGENDGIVQRAGLEALVRSAQAARLVTVQDAAHHMESDQPEQYVRLVTGFVDALKEGAPLAIDLNAVKASLAPQGRIKAGLNLSNSLLNQGQDAQGVWQGVAPDLARAIAGALDLAVAFVPYATPSQVAAAVDRDEWTLAMIATDPARSGAIAFTRPYACIEAAYLVPADSPLQDMAEVDHPGRRVAAYKGSAYGLWLERNLRHATLIDGASFEEAFARLRAGEADVLASLVPKLSEDVKAWPHHRVLNGLFMTVQQAIACRAADQQAVAFLNQFLEREGSAFIAQLISRHNATGLRPVEAA